MQRTENWRRGSYAVGTDGTLALGSNSSATVTCTITGSFTEAPKIYTTCEGHFTSTASAVSGSGNTYTTTITVKPTTAYDTTLEGKLTVYCPYYGNTGIGQLNLTATGAGIGINSVTKSGNDTQATITIDGIVEQSGEELILKAVDGDPGWISMGNVSNPSNTKLQQTLTLNPYVIGSKEDLDNGQVRQERTCTLAVVTPSGREAGYVAVNQAPIINLADQGSANCYIISAPGRYMIPARKGNSTNALWSTRPSNVSVTKTTDDGKNTVNFTSDQILFEYQGKDYIIFDIPNSIQNGNTVIALKSGDEVLWSWHLWFNTASNRADADDKLDKYVDNNGYFNGRYVMNRALGATEMTGLALSQLNNYIDLGLGDYAYYWEDGFYYQWGRKDPLQAQTASTGGTYEVAKQNPSKFYSDWTPADNAWSSTKTVDDPCPPGYKVPSSTVWRSTNPDASQFTTTSTTYTYNLSQDTGDDTPTNYIIYPYSSYLKADGAVESGHTINKEYHDPSFSYTSQGVSGQDRYSDMTLLISLNSHLGSMWTGDKLSILYQYASVSWSELTDAITIVRCKKEYRTRKISWTGITYGEWQDQGYVTGADMSVTDKAKLLLELIQKSGVISEATYEVKGETNSEIGMMVRCVKE